MDAADHRRLAELVSRGKRLGVKELKQKMIRMDGPTVCCETHVTKLHHIIVVKRPKICCKPHKQWFRGENVTILKLPSFSLDLDTIENVWGCIKDDINQKYLRDIKKLIKD